VKTMFSLFNTISDEDKLKEVLMNWTRWRLVFC
jgi:hypothetical protein